MKICISVSRGGHLDQLLQIIESFEGHDIFFLTVESEMTSNLNKNYNVHFVRKYFSEENDFLGKKPFNIISLIIYQIYVIIPSLIILIKENPNLIVCNGGEASIAISYIGKIFGKKIMYLESLTRIKELSLTGKIIYPIANIFLVQWEDLLEKYKKAKYWGRVI